MNLFLLSIRKKRLQGRINKATKVHTCESDKYLKEAIQWLSGKVISDNLGKLLRIKSLVSSKATIKIFS